MSKNLKLFTDDASRQTYEQSQEYLEPYVGGVSSAQTSSYNTRNIGKYFIDYKRSELRLSDFDINKDIIEVEYLESTGTQYINTGYIPNANTQLYIEFSLSAYNSNIKQATSPFGVRINYKQNQYVLFCPVNNTNSVYFCYGNLSQSYTQQINLNQKYVCNVNKNAWTLSSNNSTLITNTFATAQSANLPNLHLWLFKYNNNNIMPGGDDKLKIYKCTIKENDVLIHDFIPVRVGNTGYMYDKISRALFGNCGTGEFVFGPDKPKTIKYLESTGLAYIDTGIIPDVNTGIQISYSGVYKNNVNVDDFYIVGLRNDSGNTRWVIAKSGSSPAYYYGYGNYAHLPYARSYNVQYTISLNYLNNRKLTLHKTENIDLEYEEINLPNTLSFTPAYNIRIFGSAGVDASYSKAAGKMYFVKISQNNNIIMDLIPVRIGNTGYMYDKISGQLFGNSGTGEFTLGPDVV